MSRSTFPFVWYTALLRTAVLLVAARCSSRVVMVPSPTFQCLAGALWLFARRRLSL